jgi:hypothetical protein
MLLSAFGAMRSLVRQRTDSPWRTWGTAPGDCIAPKARSHYQPGATPQASIAPPKKALKARFSSAHLIFGIHRLSRFTQIYRGELIIPKTVRRRPALHEQFAPTAGVIRAFSAAVLGFSSLGAMPQAAMGCVKKAVWVYSANGLITSVPSEPPRRRAAGYGAAPQKPGS